MTNDTVPTIAEMADRYFRPTWDVITTRDDLGAIRKRSGQGDLQPPGLRQRNGITDLRLHAIDRSGQARIIQISWHKGATNAYRMAIR